MGLEHYKTVKRLESDSNVYAVVAVDKLDPRRAVVIKRLSDGVRGVQEASVAFQLRHENIIKVHECFLHDDELYLVTAYAEGGDLDSYLSSRVKEKAPPLSLATLFSYYQQLTSALIACHKANVLHRDIKPENIFLSKDCKTLYLGDFGVAKSLGDATLVTTTFVGSPMWIAPEVIAGTPYTFTADVWSLGCVFYELASYVRPFEGTPNLIALISKISSGDYTPLPATVPSLVRELIASMLQVDPSKRVPLEVVQNCCSAALAGRSSTALRANVYPLRPPSPQGQKSQALAKLKASEACDSKPVLATVSPAVTLSTKKPSQQSSPASVVAIDTHESIVSRGLVPDTVDSSSTGAITGAVADHGSNNNDHDDDDDGGSTSSSSISEYMARFREQRDSMMKSNSPTHVGQQQNQQRSEDADSDLDSLLGKTPTPVTDIELKTPPTFGVCYSPPKAGEASKPTSRQVSLGGDQGSVGDVHVWMERKRRDMSMIEHYLAEHRQADNDVLLQLVMQTPLLSPSPDRSQGKAPPPGTSTLSPDGGRGSTATPIRNPTRPPLVPDPQRAAQERGCHTPPSLPHHVMDSPPPATATAAAPGKKAQGHVQEVNSPVFRMVSKQPPLIPTKQQPPIKQGLRTPEDRRHSPHVGRAKSERSVSKKRRTSTRKVKALIPREPSEEERLAAIERERKRADDREQLRAMIKEKRSKMRNENVSENSDVAVEILIPGFQYVPHK